MSDSALRSLSVVAGQPGNTGSLYSSVGSDVYFYVSGSRNTTNPERRNVSVFGGDLVVSGNLKLEGCDLTGSFSFDCDALELTGSLEVKGKGIFTEGISGSLTRLADGTSYLIAGNNIAITSESNGSVTISSTGTGGAGDANAEYLVLTATGSLSAERVFTTGTGLVAIDGGAGGNYTLGINDSIVATVSGTTFTGATKHSAGLSGSLTRLTDGSSYLIAGNNVTIASASNGAITISSTAVAGAGGVDTQVQFNSGGSFAGDSGLTYNTGTDTLTLVNLAMTASADLVWQFKDNSAGALNIGSAGSNYWTFNTGDSQERLGFWDGVRASFGDINDPDLNIQHDGTNSRIENKTGTLILSSASGIDVSGSVKFKNGLSGSLTKLVDGSSYLIAGAGISITSSSSGAVTITNDGTVGDITAVNAGTGLTGGGTSGAVTLNINDSVVATVSGTIFTGDIGVNGGDITTTASTFNIANSNATTVQIGQGATSGINLGNSIGRNFISGYTEFNQGLSGSLTKLIDGTSYIKAGANITVTSASNGSITIEGQSTGAPTNANYLLVGGGSGLGQLSDERTFVASTGLTATDGGANGNYTLAIDNSVVATVSGTTFTGATKHNSGLSGSLTKLTDGTSYLIAGGAISIASTSNGAITISSTAITTPGGLNTHVQFNDSGSFGGVSGFAFEKATNTLTLTGGVTGSNAQFVNLKVTGTASINVLETINQQSLVVGDKYITLLSGAIDHTSLDGSGLLWGSGSTGPTVDALGANAHILYRETFDALEIFPGLNVSGSLRVTQNTTITGSLIVSSSITAPAFSGSLTKLADGTSYLIAGSGISITTGSLGAITITNDGTVGDITAVNAGTGLLGGGVSGSVTLNINDSIVATVSGTTFTGTTKHNAGLSGSLTRLTDGTSYLIAGNNVTISSSSNGSVTINSTAVAGAGGVDTQVQFNSGDSFAGDSGLTYNSSTDTLTLVNLAMTASADLNWKFKDNSAGALNIGAGGSNYWTFNTGDGQERLGFWDGVRASFGDINDPDLNIQHDGTNSRIENKTGTLILSSASGLAVSGSTKFANGLSGSLTKLPDGTSYIIAGSGISISTGSSGAITIANDGTVGDITAVNAGTGLSGGGTSGAVTLNINDSVVATVSGTTFTGVTKHNAGLSGSLTRLTDGTSYLVAGSGISITTGSSGAITITNDGTVGDITAVTAGTGLVGGGTSGAVTLNINDSVVATVSGTTFTGVTKHNAGLSGSLTKLTDGTSYLVAGYNIVLTSASNGSITIATLTGGGGGGDGFFSSTTPGSIFTTGSAAFRGTESIDSPYDKGTDVFFYVSNGPTGTDKALFEGSVVTSGSLSAKLGLSGSLTKLSDGTSAFVAGSNVTITSSSNGAVIIAASPAAGYAKGFFYGSSQDGSGNIDISTVGTLVNGYDEEADVDVFKNGQLLTAGSSNDYTVQANNTIHFNTTLNSDDVITVRLLTTGSTGSGGNGTGNAYTTTFTNASLIGGVLTVNHGLTSQYVVVTVYDNTNYQVIPDEVVATGAGVSDVYLSSFGTLTGTWTVLVVDGSGNAGDITSVVAGTGLNGGGTSGAVSLAIDDSVVATVSGTTFTGAVKFNTGLSGSLTKLTDGTSAFVAGSGIAISSASNGAVTITSTSTTFDNAASYLVLSTTASLSNERAFVASTGLTATDGGANANYTLSINNSVVATVSGTTFTGVVTVNTSSILGTIVETMSSSNGGTGVVNFSISSSSIFYVNNPAGNITANFTGVPVTNDRIISTTVILSQSSTARIVSAVQVDGASSTINWSNGVTPTGNNNKQDVFGFTLIRSGSAWKTLGQMSTFG